MVARYHRTTMTTPKERIEADLKEAMKARDAGRTSTLRLLLAAIKNEKIQLLREPDEREFASLVRKAIKQRQESIEQYQQGGRPELAAKEEQEIALLERYLPQAVSEDEVRAAIRELIAASGLQGPKAMGVVMKETIARFGGAADPSTISRVAKELLSGGAPS